MNTLAALAPRDLLTVHSVEHRAIAASSAADAARLAALRASISAHLTGLTSSLASRARTALGGIRVSARSSAASPDLCCA